MGKLWFVFARLFCASAFFFSWEAHQQHNQCPYSFELKQVRSILSDWEKILLRSGLGSSIAPTLWWWGSRFGTLSLLLSCRSHGGAGLTAGLDLGCLFQPEWFPENCNTCCALCPVTSQYFKCFEQRNPTSFLVLNNVGINRSTLLDIRITPWLPFV